MSSFTGVRREGRFTALSADRLTAGSVTAPNATVGPRLTSVTAATSGSTYNATIATMTAAQLFSGLLLSTPVTAITWTLPAVSVMALGWETAFGVAPRIGDAIELTIMNAGATLATDFVTILIDAGATWTLVGSMAVRNPISVLAGSTSATFRFVFSALGTAVTYANATGTVFRMV